MGHGVVLDKTPEELQEDQYLSVHPELAYDFQHEEGFELQYFNLLTAFLSLFRYLHDHVDPTFVLFSLRHLFVVIAYEDHRRCHKHSVDEL